METASHRIVSVRARTQTVDAFREKAWRDRREGVSPVLRRLMERYIQADTPTSGNAELAKPNVTSNRHRPVRLWVYVSESEAAAIRRQALDYGGVAPWLRGAIDSRLGVAAELPATIEIKALYAATTELWNVGRNLNQVARELNNAKRQGMPTPVAAVQSELIAELVRAVDRLAHRMDTVLAASRRRGVQRV